MTRDDLMAIGAVIFVVLAMAIAGGIEKGTIM